MTIWGTERGTEETKRAIPRIPAWARHGHAGTESVAHCGARRRGGIGIPPSCPPEWVAPYPEQMMTLTSTSFPRPVKVACLFEDACVGAGSAVAPEIHFFVAVGNRDFAGTPPSPHPHH